MTETTLQDGQIQSRQSRRSYLHHYGIISKWGKIGEKPHEMRKSTRKILLGQKLHLTNICTTHIIW